MGGPKSKLNIVLRPARTSCTTAAVSKVRSRSPEVQFLLLYVGPVIADFGRSKRPSASPKHTGKGGGLRPPPFPVGSGEAEGCLDPQARRFQDRHNYFWTSGTSCATGAVSKARVLGTGSGWVWPGLSGSGWVRGGLGRGGDLGGSGRVWG